ncbi:MAG: helix-turn-helix domain-containing protein [Oscillospiraceae bacterium]|jgi:transcriptional regulator with XRE-family HTH domain|nr:helix-turn-helix domain-containing protein [Oscillospiraceae bacterium]
MVDNEQLLKGMGKRISERRKQLRLTQDELAEKMDVTPQMISTAELGKKGIRPENLVNLCKALEVSADYILTGFIGEQDVALIAQKLSLLSPAQFRVAEEILTNCIQLAQSK